MKKITIKDVDKILGDHDTYDQYWYLAKAEGAAPCYGRTKAEAVEGIIRMNPEIFNIEFEYIPSENPEGIEFDELPLT